MPHPFDRYAAFTDLAALKEFSFKPLRKSMRVNTLKTSIDQFKQWAVEKGWTIQQVPWCPEGFFVDRINREEALGKDLLHLMGHVYMQEAASMLPAVLLDSQPGESILDMSAAPGSKTTQMSARMQGRGVIVANDVQEKRLWTLKASLQRSGVTNVIVTRKVGQWFAKHMTERFDRVLCDAPCTAQGTSRKDSDALNYCSVDNIGKMAKLQRELLESAVHAAKVGGTIVYSTCTLTPEENEELVLSILQKFPEQLEVIDPTHERIAVSGERLALLEKAIEDSAKIQQQLSIAARQSLPATRYPLLRLWPQTYDTEGFFCAVLRKKAPTRAKEFIDFVRFQEEEIPMARQREMGQLLETQFGTSFLREGDRLYQRGEQLLLATDAVAEFRLPVADYALGLPFGRKVDGGPAHRSRSEGGRIRIDHELVTLRGNDATKNTCVLSDDQLNQLLDGKDTTCDPSLSGDCVLLYSNIAVGVGLAKEGKLKNRLPRWVVQKS